MDAVRTFDEGITDIVRVGTTAARVIGRRYISSRTGERDTAIAFQMELLGLSSVGKSSDAFLEHTVRGYSRDLFTPLP